MPIGKDVRKIIRAVKAAGFEVENVPHGFGIRNAAGTYLWTVPRQERGGHWKKNVEAGLRRAGILPRANGKERSE
jgi:hypothetical protein